jgi:hypothetical protein
MNTRKVARLASLSEKFQGQTNMVKRKRLLNATNIEEHISQGFGQGRGCDYKPWLVVRDVPSVGVSSRVKGWTTKRVHELFSQLELRYFYLLDWSVLVADIREQYPLLPLEETQEIAQQLNIRHPTNPRTKDPIVMTTDFVVTVGQSIGVTEQARTVKPKEKLSSARVLEKLEIERRYWQNRGISWGIVTENEISKAFADNVAWIHPFRYPSSLSLKEIEIEQISYVLTKQVMQTDTPLAAITTDCDNQLGLPPGTSLCVARHLLASRHWIVDMNRAIQPREKLLLLKVSPQVSELQMGEVG